MRGVRGWGLRAIVSAFVSVLAVATIGSPAVAEPDAKPDGISVAAGRLRGPSAAAAGESEHTVSAAGGGAFGDRTGDTTGYNECRSDVTGLTADYKSTVIGLTLSVVCGSNPYSSPNWYPGIAGVLWLIDVDGDSLEDFVVGYGNDGGGPSVLIGDVRSGGFVPTCAVAPGWNGNNVFGANFDPACIGRPTAFRVLAGMIWDENPYGSTCVCATDVVPDDDFTGPISAPPPPLSPLGDGPGVASPADNVIDVFARGGDDALWTRHFAGSWGSWRTLGGIISGTPAVASRAPGTLDVFARGADNALWTRRFTGTSWTPWATLGGILSTAPAVVSASPGTMNVFVAGADGALWMRTFNGTSWSAWSTRGGYINATPTAASPSPGRIDVFARGGDNALWTQRYSGSWGPWATLGGNITSAPGATSSAPGTVEVFARGGDNALWTRRFNGAWSSWASLGGGIASPPAPVSALDGTVDVFIRGQDAALWTIHRNGGSWGVWRTLGGIIK